MKSLSSSLNNDFLLDSLFLGNIFKTASIMLQMLTLLWSKGMTLHCGTLDFYEPCNNPGSIPGGGITFSCFPFYLL